MVDSSENSQIHWNTKIQRCFDIKFDELQQDIHQNQKSFIQLVLGN